MIHKVVAGECLITIARQYGFPDWRTIYDHARNASFRKLRPNPNVIAPGDEVFIPPVTHRSATAPTGQVHKFVVAFPKAFLCLKLLESFGGKVVDAHFLLKVEGEAKPHKGRIGQDGLLSVAIPALATQAYLTLIHADSGEIMDQYELKIGALDPVETLSGVQARLRRMGYNCGPSDGILGPQTDRALRTFQRKHRLPISGEADSATQSKLNELLRL